MEQEDTEHNQVQSKSERKRPLVRTSLGVIGFIGVFFELIRLFIIPHPLSEVIMGFVFVALYVIGLLFIWKMTLWGLIFYTCARVTGFVIFTILGFDHVRIQLIPLISIVLLWTQYKKMS